MVGPPRAGSKDLKGPGDVESECLAQSRGNEYGSVTAQRATTLSAMSSRDWLCEKSSLFATNEPAKANAGVITKRQTASRCLLRRLFGSRLPLSAPLL